MMSYRKNWLRHALANVSGHGFNDGLAKDFWTARENLWDPERDVPHRGWKFLFAYSMSAIAQITLPCTVIGIPIILVQHHSWIWLPIGIGIGTTIGILGALVATLKAQLEISDKRQQKISAGKAK